MTEGGFRRNTSLMAIGTVLSRVTGFARTVLIVNALGVQDFGDTYTLANTIPNIVYDLIIGGVLSATLVPVFASYFAKKNDDEAWEAVSAVFTAILAAIVLVTIAVMVAAPLIIDLYTLLDDSAAAEEQRETATFLLRWFAPQIAVYGLVSVATALLHTRRRFAPPMFAPVLNNLVVIAILLSLPFVADDVSLEAMSNDPIALSFLGFGTTLGVVAMGAVLIPYVRATSKGQLRIRPNFKHPALSSVLRMSGWTVGFVIANQIAYWVTILLAGRALGGIVAFALAYQLFILPHGVLSVSIMSALQPELAESWAKQALADFKKTMAMGLRVLLLVVVPIGLLMAVLAGPMVEIIFHFTSISNAQESDITQLVALMTIGLPGFSAFLFLTRVLQAMHAARTVFYLYVFENAVNIVTAVPLFEAMGIAGLGLSNSIAYSVGAVAAFFAIRRRVGAVGGKALMSSFLRILTASILMASASFAIAQQLEELNPILQLIVGGGAGLFLMLALLRVLAPNEFLLVLRMPGRRRKETLQ